ncbi:MAG: allantoinase AllB [Candidatus Hadarchaeum sp.]|uniref:allantoinase AllB n=1 Tax=Candidatus Hadarchaeum sp. TaxID=2883567 RepID=UPI003D0EB278
MSVDLLLNNGTIVTSAGEFKASVAVDEGKIVAIGSAASMPPAEKVLDLSGLHVLPGFVDAHVHMREPGLTYKEDFLSGTSAAAAGGVTTIFEMPNTLPLVTNEKILLEKAALLKDKAYVDFCLYGLIVEDNVNELAGMARAGAIGFKLLLAEVTGGVPRPSNGLIFESFKELAKIGLTVSVHAEDKNVTQYYTEKLKAVTKEPIAHCWARPPIAEEEGIQLLTLFAAQAGNKVHLVHTSCGVDLIRAAKAAGTKITAETCPQYLVFSEEDMRTKGAVLKINPPVRSKVLVQKLIEAVNDGTIDTIGSDHAPHSVEEKTKESIWEASSGCIGVETMVPVMLTLVNKGLIKLGRLVEMGAENPAKIFDLYPRKGAIAVGSDADFTIVDLKMEKTIKAEELHSKQKVTPFEGFRVKGLPVYTIVRGEIVAERGEILGGPKGIFVRP